MMRDDSSFQMESHQRLRTAARVEAVLPRLRSRRVSRRVGRSRRTDMLLRDSLLLRSGAHWTSFPSFLSSRTFVVYTQKRSIFLFCLRCSSKPISTTVCFSKFLFSFFFFLGKMFIIAVWLYLTLCSWQTFFLSTSNSFNRFKWYNIRNNHSNGSKFNLTRNFVDYIFLTYDTV